MFLRFFVSAIINPHTWGLLPGPPPSSVQHTLKLIGRGIQSLANLNQEVHKDSHGKEFALFHEDNSPQMRDFLNTVCTPTPDDRIGNRFRRQDDAIPDSRLQVMQSIHRQHARRSDLEREAMGSLPYLIDVPHQLAILASLLAGHCKKIEPETFNKRGIPLTAASLQQLATLTWQGLTVRDHAFRLMAQGIKPQPYPPMRY